MLDFPRWKVWAVTLPILVGILLAIPSMMSEGRRRRKLPGWMPDARISLGLDIAGGSQLLLEADAADAAKQRLAGDGRGGHHRASPRRAAGSRSATCRPPAGG